MTMTLREKITHKPKWREQNYLPQRYVVALMAFCGTSCVYMLRINLNLAIVAMVHPTDTRNNSVDINECSFEDANSTVSDEYKGEFQWNEMTQGLILGSFFWGYIWTQVPGGRLADVFGAKIVYGSAVFGSGILTMLLPLAANHSYKTLMALRVMLGAFQGACFPANHALLSSWAPPNERSTLSAFVYAGGQFGIITGFPLTALILDVYGWEAVFYIQGCVAILWTVFWIILVSDGPRDARWITDTEKEYILGSLGESKEKEVPPFPWTKATTSLPVWAILLAGVGNNWGFYTLLTDLPLYMKEILKQDITSNAMLSAMPYAGMFVFGIVMSNIADFMRSKNMVSTVVVRKVANTISQVGPAICLVSLSFVECDRVSTIVLLFLAVTFHGGIYTGFMVNHIDIAPNFAGTLLGITNAPAAITAFLAPMTVGALTNGNQTLGQWRKVFYISAVLYVADAVFYVIFASGEEQEWNRIQQDPEDGSPSSKNDAVVSKKYYPFPKNSDPISKNGDVGSKNDGSVSKNIDSYSEGTSGTTVLKIPAQGSVLSNGNMNTGLDLTEVPTESTPHTSNNAYARSPYSMTGYVNQSYEP